MKKNLFYFVTTALVLSGCTSEEVIDDVVASGNLINFEAAVSKPSRAQELTVQNLMNFNVFGFYTAKDAPNHANMVFNNVSVTNGDGLGNGIGSGVWTIVGSNNKRYWLKDNTYYFYAYSCGSVSKLDESYGSFSINMSNEGEGVPADQRVLEIKDYLCDNNHQHDLICASNTNIVAQESNNSNVSFAFKHVLSKIEAGFTNNFQPEYDVVIKNVSIRNVNNIGNYNFNTGWSDVKQTGEDLAPTVYLLDTEGNNRNNFDKDGKPIKDAAIKATHDIVTVNGVEQQMTANTQAAFVIPCIYPNKNVYINFDIDLMLGEDVVLSKTLVATIQPEWETGKAYRYNIALSASAINLGEIQFSVTGISSWDTFDNDGEPLVFNVNPDAGN